MIMLARSSDVCHASYSLFFCIAYGLLWGCGGRESALIDDDVKHAVHDNASAMQAYSRSMYMRDP